MIQKASNTDINTLVSLVYQANQDQKLFSAFMPKTKESIHKELQRAITEEMAFVYRIKNQIKGVLTYFQTADNTVDVMGPFVLEKDFLIAQALLDYCMKLLNHPKMNFFVNADSPYYETLMKACGAEVNQYEYHLQLERNAFQAFETDLCIKKAQSSDRQAIESLHNTVFQDVYLTSAKLLEKSRYPHIRVITQQSVLIGYALLIPKQHTVYLEVFAIHPRYQGQGLGTQFLSSIIQDTFNTSTVQNVSLIVDVVNEKALYLYFKLGFKTAQSLVSYQIR